MITLFLGEDTAKARSEFIQYKESLIQKNYNAIEINSSNISEIKKWIYDSQSLFAESKFFFGSNLASDKKMREELAIFDTLDSVFELILYEENMEERIAKFLFKHAKIVAFKLPTTIFKLLDSLSPKTIPQSLLLLHELASTIDENIIFIMICRRVRELILAQSDMYSKKLASWQQTRIKSQSQLWDKHTLISFYESLFRIDTLQKTSKNYYSLIESLDISLTFYVR
jgi:hypothetical protein